MEGNSWHVKLFCLAMISTRAVKVRALPKQNDELLKSIFLQNIEDGLRFLYPQADEIFDFGKPIVPVDKEFMKLAPNRKNRKGKRNADLLVEVSLRNGEQTLVLIHMEIESGNDKNFPVRMFDYYYHIRDRYGKPILSIAIFIGNKRQNRPGEYHVALLDTELTFKYRSYHILDHSEEELLAMDNIFAYIILACQKALLEGKVPEEELAAHRSTISRALISSGKYDNERIRNFLAFLINIIHINNEQINAKFVKDINKLTGGAIAMTPIEVLQKQAGERGIRKGRAEERAKAKAQTLEHARRMLARGHAVSETADVLDLSVKEVEALK